MGWGPLDWKGVLVFVNLHMGPDVFIFAFCSSQKENDNFNISKKDIEITLFHGESETSNCTFENITRNQDLTTIFCKIKHITSANSIAASSKKVRVSRLTVLPIGFPFCRDIPWLNQKPGENLLWVFGSSL